MPPAPLVATGVPYRLTRLGVLMSAEPGAEFEAEGVLNPASGRSPDGTLWLLPRMVAAGNVSRVGIAEILIRSGRPAEVRRDGVVLAPDAGWERSHDHGGVEDPRTTWIDSLGVHVMSYVAFGPLGPKPAVAVSRDLRSWRRLGPVPYTPADAVLKDVRALAHVRSHRLVALPEYDYEAVKIGAGPPPLRVKEGWLLVHHGVSGTLTEGWGPQRHVRYSAGAMLLDPDDPGTVLARSPSPLLEPLAPEERVGAAPNVVFPTAIEEIDGQQFVFYGMADSSIGVASLDRMETP